MRLEILGRPLGVKFRIQGHLGVGKGEKPPFGQNCPNADATIKWKTLINLFYSTVGILKFILILTNSAQLSNSLFILNRNCHNLVPNVIIRLISNVQ